MSSSEENKTKIKHIVCSGGGHNGFTFYGILRELNKRGFWKIEDIETIYATSVGTFFALFLALKYDWDVLDDYLVKRPWNLVFKIDMYSIINSFNKGGIFDFKVIEETFLPIFNAKDVSIDITMKEFFELTKIELHFFTTEMNSFSTIDISYKTHPDWKLLDAVYSSSALPILFSPFFKDGKCYYDGGILSNYPIDHCINSGVLLDEVFGIIKHGNSNVEYIEIEEKKTLIDYIMLIFSKIVEKLTNTKLLRNKIKNEILVNCVSTSLESVYNCTTNIEDRVKLIKLGVDLADNFYHTSLQHCIDE